MHESSFEPAVGRLAERIGSLIGDNAVAQMALALVRERAPDEGLALAFLLQLAEQSPVALREALRDRDRAADLIFCLGASELVAAGLCAIGPGWRAFFDEARVQTTDAPVRSLVFDAGGITDRAEAARALGEFKSRMFLRIVIGDLLGLLGVTGTMTAMSRLADECIRAALAMAQRLLKPGAGGGADFCVVALGKLGACELNLSSDIDLMYLSTSDGADGGMELRRRGELFTLIFLSCFRTG